MVAVNSTLDADTVKAVGQEYGVDVLDREEGGVERAARKSGAARGGGVGGWGARRGCGRVGMGGGGGGMGGWAPAAPGPPTNPPPPPTHQRTHPPHPHSHSLPLALTTQLTLSPRTTSSSCSRGRLW